MKILVAYSGGKDNQACLLWAAKKYDARLDLCVEKAYHDLIKEIEELPEKDRIRKWLGMFA
jgi:tRNA(Ile)-lysidine synthase TilS/MesJ